MDIVCYLKVLYGIALHFIASYGTHFVSLWYYMVLHYIVWVLMLSVCVSQYGCLLHIVCHMTLTKSQFLLFSTLPNTQLSSNYTALYHCHRCRAAIGCSVFRLGLVDYKRHPQTPVYTNPPEQQPDEDPLQERRK